MEDVSAAQQIDDIINNTAGWQGRKLAELRTLILRASPEIHEEVKWKKPSKPEGVAVWTANGNVCIADILKNAVRLTFPKGARLRDPSKFFNTRLDSKTMRAVDFADGDRIDEQALIALVREAISVNA